MPANQANSQPRSPATIVSLLLLFAAGLINFFDRSSLGVAATSIRAELHLSATEIGALLSVFSFAYGIAQLPLAAYLRPRNAQRTLGAGLLLWSCAQAASGAVHRFGTFLALRVVLGAGESPFYPAGVYLIRQNTAEHQRGRATAVLNLASTLGLAMAPPLLTVLMLRYGWRGMFLALGVAGTLLAVLWLLLPSTAAANDGSSGAAALPFAALLRQRTIWGMMLGFGGLNYVNWFFISWLPGYLETGRHLSIRSSGWIAATPFLAGACGALSSGVVTDLLIRQGRPAARMYRACIIVGLLLCGGTTALADAAATTRGAVVLVSAAVFFLQFAGTSGWGLVQSMAPPANVAAASALQNFGSFMLASLAPVITGRLLDRTHSFQIAFWVCGGMAVFGAACYATLTHRPIALAEVAA
ncbi:MFS transporter [Terriglobus aquaticus]|uniref:MFS transporter n=1 Tax=Terriglobus aquaticus TaxID=940139 RepID=A0ABW9KI42_9BACT|nr:MFS transporter [Terriglobus aquaticus]